MTLLLINTLLLAMLCGYFTAHSIVLGRWFDWFLTEGKHQELAEHYGTFRRARNPVPLYMAGFIVQFVCGIVMAAVGFGTDIPIMALIAAVVAFALMVGLHMASGFSRVESAIMSGETQDTTAVARFLRLNQPVHLLDALIYAAAAIVCGWAILRMEPA